MITKNLFVDSIKAIEKLDTLDSKLYNLGISLEIDEISNIAFCLSRLLSYCTEDKEDKYGTMIDFYLYEGDKLKDRMWDRDGNVIPLKDVEDLWNFFIKENPNIEDKNNS